MRIFFIVFLLFCQLSAQAQTAEQIVHKYIKFIGGEKNWKKVTCIVSSGEYDYGGVAFPFTAYSKTPNRYKFIVPANGKYYAQAFDGITGWKFDGFKNETKATLLEGKAALAMANEADVELESPFIDYKKKGHQIRLESKETIENKSYFKVNLTHQNGESEVFYFEETTLALFLKIAISKNVELESAILHTYYSDYKKVGDLFLPHKLVSKVGDQTTLTISIKEIQLNTEIKDSEFKPTLN